MPVNVPSLVVDPEFMKMSPADQQATLAQVDPEFGKLSPADFNATLVIMQKQSVASQAPTSAMPGSPSTQPINKVAPNGMPANNLQATPDEQTPESNAAAIAQRDAQSPVLSTMGHAATGFVKGAEQTLAPGPRTAAAIKAATGIDVPSTQSPSLQPNGTAENIGYGAEGIAEFVLGDEALKSMQLGDKLLKVQKVADAYENGSPFVKQAMNAAMKIVGSSARAATVAGAQSELHGQDVATGAETGAVGGAIGGGLGTAADYLATKTPEAVDAAAKAQAEQQLLDKVDNDLVMQSDANRAVHSAAYGAVQNATGVSPTNADLLNKNFGDYTFGDAAKDIKEHFDPVYDQIRKASTLPDGGNAFDIANNQIKTANQVLRNPSTIEAAQSAQKVKGEAQRTMENLFQTSGVDKPSLDAARKGWRVASTLEDLHDSLDKAYTEGSASRSMTGNSPTIDPKKFVTRMNNAVTDIGADNLKSALGDNAADQLIKVTQQFRELAKSDGFNSKVQSLAKQILAANPTPKPDTIGSLVGGGGLSLIAHFAGASNPVAAGLGGIAATMHWAYTHPTIAAPMLSAISKAAPSVVTQSLRQVTHVYNPGTQKAEPVQQ